MAAPTSITSRTQIGLPLKVTTINRITLRRRLARGLGLVVVHYTGVDKRYQQMSRDEQVKQIRNIHNYHLVNEYNYVILPSGEVVEFAGEYQAAATKGYNDRSYSVLFLLGVNEQPTAEMVESFRWLMGCLKWVGAILPTAWVVQHKQLMPTACPGNMTKVWDQLVAP